MYGGPLNHVQNADRLIAKFQQLRKTHVKAAIRKGTRAGAKEQQKLLKAAAPVGTKRRKDRGPGFLRRNVKVRAIKRSRVRQGHRAFIYFGVGKAFYGSFIELGWVHDNRRKKTKLKGETTAAARRRNQEGRKKIPGTRWMRDTARKYATRVLKISADAIAAEIVLRMKL